MAPLGDLKLTFLALPWGFLLCLYNLGSFAAHGRTSIELGAVLLSVAAVGAGYIAVRIEGERRKLEADYLRHQLRELCESTMDYRARVITEMRRRHA